MKSTKPGWRRKAASAERADGQPFLSVRSLGAREKYPTRSTLGLYRGQVLSLSGLLWSGRTETARLLFGIDHAESAGTTAIDGAAVKINSPRKAVRYGLAFCPEDRKTEGIIADLSIRENIILALRERSAATRLPAPARAERDGSRDDYIRQLGIRTPDAEKPIGQLSGNQQKALLARWLATEPKMLILDQRGIDIAAKLEIMDVVGRCAPRGSPSSSSHRKSTKVRTSAIASWCCATSPVGRDRRQGR